MRMKIALDISTVNPNNLTGISRYTLQLWNHLKNDDILTPLIKLSRFRNISKYQKLFGRRPNLYHPKFMIGLKKYDLFHGPDFQTPDLRSILKVATIHDLCEFEPGFHSGKFQLQAQKKMKDLFTQNPPDHLIAVSNFTKNKILEFFPEFNGKVTTVYHGIEYAPVAEGFNPLEKPASLNTINKKFLLYIGTIEHRKNVSRIIDAFILSELHKENYLLVLAGGPGFGHEEILKKAHSSNSILSLGFVNELEKNWLYNHAEFFIFPSLYEGFGLPVLEAMSYGLPVVTSENSACSEVTESAALLVDPQSISEISTQMKRLASSLETRNLLKEKGLKQAQKFSWKKTAEETKQVYIKTLSH